MNYFILNEKSKSKIGPFTEDDVIIKEIDGTNFYCHRFTIDDETGKELVLSPKANHKLIMERF